MLKAISFDLDDTLAETNFEEAVWFDEIPKLYSKKFKIPFEEARKIVLLEYEQVGDARVEWYEVAYWFEKFGFEEDYKKIMSDLKGTIKLFPDTIPALKKLKQKFPLYVVSNASRDFIDFKIKIDGLESYFSKVFSMTSDYKKPKAKDTFLRVCGELDLKPSELLHVGDNYDFDYAIPKSAGINAVFLNRKNKDVKEGVLQAGNLKEFEEIVSSLK